jgi:glycosyltransferase involved in cell wall biosynthesis
MSGLSILFVTPAYPPVLGGAETHAARLAATLTRRGHHVTVVTMWAPSMPRAMKWVDPAGVRVRSVGRRLPVVWRARAFVLASALAPLLARRKYDVVHVFLAGLHGTSALLGSAIRSIPAALMFGGPSEIAALHTTRLGRLQLISARRFARRVVALSASIRTDLCALGISETRIVSQACSVDPFDFEPLPADRMLELRDRHAIARDARVAVFTGRFVAEKSLHTLVEAFGLVRQTLPDALLILVGEGPLRTALEASSVSHAAAVRFAGRLPSSGVREHLQLSDVFALVSSSEGLPCAVIEAMSCARAAVVSDAAGVAQLIDDGVHGLVVPIGAVRATADALVRLLLDPALAARLGAAARARAIDRFSADVVATSHERMYAEMLVRPGGKTARLTA